MSRNGGPSVYVLYKITNSESDKGEEASFNAFPLPRGAKTSLAVVKKSCAALYQMNHLGPDGYHWRICVEDKPMPGETPGSFRSFSWWDIQDENATLPVKSATQYQLGKLFSAQKEDSSDVATKAAKATFKSLGKAMSQAVGADVGDQGPLVNVVTFKLLDLTKIHDEFVSKNTAGLSAARIPQQPSAPRPAAPPRRSPPPPSSRPAPQSTRQPAARPPASQPRPAAPQQRPRGAAEPSLMDFGGGASTTSSNSGSRPGYHHSSSLPSRASPPANESRAEKLKREYNKKNQTAQRVWDPVDERYVEVQPKKVPGTGAPPTRKKPEVGIKLDPSSARGKPRVVQQAVKERYDDMRGQQAKAVNEVRIREAEKKKAEADEDAVRKILEPKIKVWAEEHGKKKQLRALLASLHTILWQGAKWKQVTIGDLLDDKKVTRSFQRASLVVHPDKTGHLDAEKRFLAKRIFDALCQAKADFDNGKK